MHLYNTTFGVDKAVETEFLNWLKAEFIPSAVADSEYFTSPELFKVGMEAEPGVASYALHLRAANVDDIARWYEDHGSRLFSTILERWNQRVVFFSTTLEAI